MSDYKTKIIIGLGMLLFGIIVSLNGGDISVGVFFIIISLLGFLVILLDYIAELKTK